MIKAIIFDWGGVLFDEPTKDIMAYCAKKLAVNKEQFYEIHEKLKPDLQKGIISEDVFWEKICSILKVKKPNVPSLWGDAFKNAYRPKKDMFAVATNLKNKGYKIALLSNTEIEPMNYFYEQQYDMFDVAVFSCVEGTIKPESKIYEIVLKRLNVEPHETVFIDDNPAYITAAKKLGIITIIFETTEQAKHELNSLLSKV